mmetsp:Transcript_9422/g.34581  ORF Transcript_9422/g.34581 Transcript_9422/m.34581 type:complete len:92 (+) Transcript_9422:1121-1396(+)
MPAKEQKPRAPRQLVIDGELSDAHNLQIGRSSGAAQVVHVTTRPVYIQHSAFKPVASVTSSNRCKTGRFWSLMPERKRASKKGHRDARTNL